MQCYRNLGSLYIFLCILQLTDRLVDANVGCSWPYGRGFDEEGSSPTHGVEDYLVGLNIERSGESKTFHLFESWFGQFLNG